VNKDKMIRKQIYLEPRQDEKIKMLSSVKEKSEAEIIRDAVDQYLTNEKGHLQDPIKKLIGLVEAKDRDGSLLHDQHLIGLNQDEYKNEKE
jgi:hypothetical protein